MRGISVVAVIVATAALFGACGRVRTPTLTSGTAVSGLSFPDVQQKAVAAAGRSGLVFHNIDTAVTSSGLKMVTETWIDAEQHVARSELNGSLKSISGPEKMALLSPSDGRYAEALYSWAWSDEPFHLLDYLGRLAGPSAQGAGITEATVDGAAAIAVRVQREVNADGEHRTEKATIYLDGSFLPIKMELDIGAGAESRTTHTFRSEYVPREATPSNFFSFDQVRAIAKTSADLLREAAQSFGRAYWLGEPFEGMVVTYVFGGARGDQGSTLRTQYGAPDAGAGGPDAPFPCAEIDQFTTANWDDLTRGATDAGAAGRIQRDTMTVLGGQAQVFELPAERVMEQPRVEGQPPPTPATLAESSVWEADLVLSDAAVRITVSCGPPGKNRFRSLAGVCHLLESLQVLQAE